MHPIHRLRLDAQTLRPTILVIVGADCPPGAAAVFVARALDHGHRLCVATFDAPAGALGEIVAACEIFLPKGRLWTVRPGGTGWDHLPADLSVVVMTSRTPGVGHGVDAVLIDQDADPGDTADGVDRLVGSLP